MLGYTVHIVWVGVLAYTVVGCGYPLGRRACVYTVDGHRRELYHLIDY